VFSVKSYKTFNLS